MENQKSFKKERAEKKTSQQQEGYRAKIRLEGVKNKFINLLMRNGEKSKAQKLLYDSLNELQSRKPFIIDENSGDLCEKRNQNFFDLFVDQSKRKSGKRANIEKNRREYKRNQVSPCRNDNFFKSNTLYQAVENVKPALELRRVRKGGTTYQVPAIVNQKRQERLAIKWIIESAKKRKKKSKKSFSNCLVREIVEASNKAGQPRQKRDEQLKIAEYNRAYTRYRWW